MTNAHVSPLFLNFRRLLVPEGALLLRIVGWAVLCEEYLAVVCQWYQQSHYNIISIKMNAYSQSAVIILRIRIKWYSFINSENIQPASDAVNLKTKPIVVWWIPTAELDWHQFVWITHATLISLVWEYESICKKWTINSMGDTLELLSYFVQLAVTPFRRVDISNHWKIKKMLQMATSVQFTVGKVDAGMAILLSPDHHLIEFPATILPVGLFFLSVYPKHKREMSN